MVSCGEAFVKVRVNGRVVSLCCLVMEKRLPQFGVVLGVDAIKELVGLRLHADGSLHFGLAAVLLNRWKSRTPSIEDNRFFCHFRW